MANPSGNHQEQTHVSSCCNDVSGGNPNNGNSAMESSGTAMALKHNSGISLDWTAEEQAILEEELAKFTSESLVTRYIKIAPLLQNKTVRDVALRVKWMTMLEGSKNKENSKRRKDDNDSTRKSKDKKERVSDPSAKSSHFAAQPNAPLYAPAMIMMDNDDGISYKAIGGPTGELLEQNLQALNRISLNLAAFQIQDNFNLFCQTRDNLLQIMNDSNNLPEVMKQMPPLPVEVNEELANSILPTIILPMQL